MISITGIAVISYRKLHLLFEKYLTSRAVFDLFRIPGETQGAACAVLFHETDLQTNYSAVQRMVHCELWS